MSVSKNAVEATPSSPRAPVMVAECRNPQMAEKLLEEINQAIIEEKPYFDVSQSPAAA